MLPSSVLSDDFTVHVFNQSCALESDRHKHETNVMWLKYHVSLKGHNLSTLHPVVILTVNKMNLI